MAIQSVIALFASFSISMSVLETASGIIDRLRTVEATVEGSKVIEVFKAETVTDLEEAVSDGYPMPWLQEILNDKTIPEEDRYWLDCRMRAALAQELHLFFDREGNPVYVEAFWIGPGERYWQEYMMMRPILPREETSRQMPDDSDFLDLLAKEAQGQTQVAFSSSSPTLMSDPPGKVTNLYGEEVGVLAVVHKNLSLSRDASIGAIQSGRNIDAHWDRTPYACILYSDGSFVESPLEYLGQYRAAVSEDGSTVVFVLTRAPSITAAQQPVDAFFYDRDGNLTGRVTPPEQFSTNYAPQLSPSGALCCCGLFPVNALIFNTVNQECLGVVTPSEPGRTVQILSFSPGGNYLCTGGHSSGRVYDSNSLEQIWEGPLPWGGGNYFCGVSCSEDLSVVVLNERIGTCRTDYTYIQSIYQNSVCVSEYGYEDHLRTTDISPSGRILVSQREGTAWIRTGVPIVVQVL